MKYKLPIVSLILAALTVAWVAADSRRTPPEERNVASPDSQASLPVGDGNRLVQEAIRQVAQVRNISGQVRQRVQVFGRKVASSGRYRQWNDGQLTRFRLDLRTQTGDEPAHLLLLGDGRFLWRRRAVPGRRSLQRVDWEAVRRRMADAERAGRMPSLELPVAAAYGLAGILGRLAAHFDFDTPQPGEIGREGIPVWNLVGSWKPESLSRYYPSAAKDVQKGKLKHLPEPVPTHVELVLGNDDVLPYFPYRISLLRRSQEGTVRLMDLEFFALAQNVPLDPADFRYDPGGQAVDDATEAVIARLFGSDMP